MIGSALNINPVCYQTLSGIMFLLISFMEVEKRWGEKGEGRERRGRTRGSNAKP